MHSVCSWCEELSLCSFAQVSLWLRQEAEPRLKNLSKEEEDDSLQLVIKKQQQFKELYASAHVWANNLFWLFFFSNLLWLWRGKDFNCTPHSVPQDYCQRGEALLKRLERWEGVSTADLHVYEVRINSFWTLVQSFSERLEATGQNIQQAYQLYSFLDQVHTTAVDTAH